MPLKMCVPCERLFLYEEDASGVDGGCPYCAGTVSQPPVRTMRDLPQFRFELVRGSTGLSRGGDLTDRVSV